jgi:hypothetical protein
MADEPSEVLAFPADSDEWVMVGNLRAPLPDDAETCRVWGWHFATQPPFRLGPARRLLARSVRINPESMLGWLCLGMVCCGQEDFAAGLAALDRAEALGLGDYAECVRQARERATEALRQQGA